jgi:putative membrane protein
VLALLVPWPLIYLTNWPVEFIYLAQLGAFLLGALILQWEAPRFAVVPGSIKRARAHQKAVEPFTTHLRRGQRVKGFVTAIEACSKILAEHFPPGRIDLNEPPNHVIVLDAS